MSRVVVCSIVTKSHLSHARTLAQTLRAHDPEAELHVLLADRVDGAFDPETEPFHLIPLESLGGAHADAVKRMTFYYSPVELCCGLRGLLHQYMLDHTSADAWVFLDADIMVCASLAPVFAQLATASIVLNPHRTTPAPLAAADPEELNVLRSGVYNAGFVAIRRTDEARRFVRWFAERLERFAFDDHTVYRNRALFADQLWLNLVPGYFREVQFCTHPGANLAHWNLLERSITRDESGRFMANGEPLLFVHFSGWDIERPSLVSRYAPAPEFDGNVSWGALGRLYREKLLANGYESTSDAPYAFASFEDGTHITPMDRHYYYDRLLDGTWSSGSPFRAAVVPRADRGRSWRRFFA